MAARPRAPAGAFPWREDGRCGNATVAPDGSRPAICNPWQPDGLTCCLDTGLCAPSGTPGCVEHKLQQPWRRDGTCGPDIRAIDGSLPSICNPLDPYNNTCCSDQGWCGRSADHCGCRDCMQYGAVCSCLDDAAPWVDVGLPGGTRLHAVLPPVSAGGTCLSLRVLRRCAQPLADLEAGGALPGESGALVRAVVARRVAFLVTGGTGSGKTTLLSALLGEVDPAERLVLCEDAAELTPPHPHVVRLLTRPPNVEGAGAVGLRDLVRQALRMRPDRLVVGEVRGPEVVDLLAALNTGHDGGCGTLHANRAAEVPARLEALGVAAGLGRAAVHSQTAAALDVVLHLRRTPAGRQVSEIGLLRRQGELVVVEPGWRADGGHCPSGEALRRLLAGP